MELYCIYCNSAKEIFEKKKSLNYFYTKVVIFSEMAKVFRDNLRYKKQWKKG